MSCTAHSKLLNQIFFYADSTPDKVAIICGKVSVTYSNLKEAIIRTAATLSKYGFVKGDRIMLAAVKDVRFFYVYFASHLIGCVNVIVDSNGAEQRNEYIFRQTVPKYIVGLDGKMKLGTTLSFENLCMEGESLSGSPVVEAGDIADIMFTTGTTGAAKGVLLSYANIDGAIENINHFIRNTSKDVELIGLPVCHSFGLGRSRCALSKGQTVILLGSFTNVKLFFETMDKYHVSGFGMVPAAWQYIRMFSGDRIKKFASQINYIEIGSSAMPKSEKEHLAELFPNTRICMHYGLTEASRAFFMEFHQYRDKLTSIGEPVSAEVMVKICDEAGNALDIESEGEICIKGNMVTHSYLSEEDNNDAFWGDYFRTGDWGCRDAQGCYYLKGRKKGLINVGGKKVSPSEIEEALTKMGIKDCACIAIPDPKGVLGEVPKAFMQKSAYMPTDREIRDYLSGCLERYKIPYEFEWIDKIPRTASGKLLRFELKDK